MNLDRGISWQKVNKGEVLDRVGSRFPLTAAYVNSTADRCKMFQKEHDALHQWESTWLMADNPSKFSVMGFCQPQSSNFLFFHIVTWEPEGRYRCTKPMVILPFWLSADDIAWVILNCKSLCSYTALTHWQIQICIHSALSRLPIIGSIPASHHFAGAHMPTQTQ